MPGVEAGKIELSREFLFPDNGGDGYTNLYKCSNKLELYFQKLIFFSSYKLIPGGVTYNMVTIVNYTVVYI